MAKPSKPSQLIVTCSVCGKQIVPEGNYPIPTNYLWSDGKNYCHECMVAGKASKNPIVRKGK